VNRATGASPEVVLAQVDGDLVPLDRATVHRRGLQHYCVHLLCVRRDTVYLQRRAANRHRNANAWTSTVSGHISADDAAETSRAMPKILIDRAAIHALLHEYAEELGTPLPDDIDVQRVAEVPSVSRGDGEICNCTALVFVAAVRQMAWKPTLEVQEVCAFSIRQIEFALQRGLGLSGTDGVVHPFADNFAPVFNVALAALDQRETGA